MKNRTIKKYENLILRGKRVSGKYAASVCHRLGAYSESSDTTLWYRKDLSFNPNRKYRLIVGYTYEPCGYDEGYGVWAKPQNARFGHNPDYRFREVW